ncbi:hypothetical protein [Chitinophaga niabensis]|uniref:Uncharacterized protein n=1 Tax=Chitinophaga niabensis TaxID=536979 RepID=A0A1N6KBR2_9BACT|nr:hypothetical protein [Chitinophaga niabensis]SIO53981.1 hypothetical protein SAMN04488055_5516 [Chitinophaga niabensis]
MEKLFALHNIQFVNLERFHKEDSYDVYWAYTEDLLGKSVLIEIYGVYVGYSEVPEDLEVAIIANCLIDDSIYKYYLFSSDNLFGPLPITRFTADAIAYIESCNKNDVLTPLKEICTSWVSYNYKEHHSLYDKLVREFHTAIELIKEKKGKL